MQSENECATNTRSSMNNNIAPKKHQYYQTGRRTNEQTNERKKE